MSEYTCYQSQKKAYNKVAKNYEQKMAETFVGALNRHVQDDILNEITPIIKDYSSILDLGCGDGIFMRKITKINPTILSVGIDASDELIELGKKQSSDLMSFYVGDAMKHNLKSKFDVIIALALIHRLSDVTSFFNNLNKINHSETIHVITTMNNYSPQFMLLKLVVFFFEFIKRPLGNHVAKKGFSFSFLKKLMEDTEFEIIEIKTTGFLGNFGTFKVNKYVLLLFSFIDRIIGKIPLLKRLGVFTVVIFKRKK
tara:strand:+ start:1599 stop:2363 length:765 start_codon:yes stop_codon:yes gene_type:complete